MSIPQLPAAATGAAYNPATAAQPPATPYFGRVHFGAAEDSVEISGADATEQTDGEQPPTEGGEASAASGGTLKKALVKLGLAGALAAAGIVFFPAFAAAALFAVWGLLDIVKGAKAGKSEGDDTPAEDAPAEEPPADDAPPADEELAPEVTGDGAADADALSEVAADDLYCEGEKELALSGEKITLFQAADLFAQKSKEALKANKGKLPGTPQEIDAHLAAMESASKPEKVFNLVDALNTVIAPQYKNVDELSENANGNRKIDKAVVDELFSQLEKGLAAALDAQES